MCQQAAIRATPVRSEIWPKTQNGCEKERRLRKTGSLSVRMPSGGWKKRQTGTGCGSRNRRCARSIKTPIGHLSLMNCQLVSKLLSKVAVINPSPLQYCRTWKEQSRRPFLQSVRRSLPDFTHCRRYMRPEAVPLPLRLLNLLFGVYNCKTEAACF